MSVNTVSKFLKITTSLSDNNSFEMSGAAYKLFIALNRIEADKCQNLIFDNTTGYYGFLCTDAEIRKLTGMNEKSIQKAKNELKSHELIKVGRGDWHYKSSGKSDIKQPCKYFILK